MTLILGIGDLLPALGHLPILQQALEVATERDSLQGETAALANRLGVSLLLSRGRPERAAELARATGIVQSVAVLGPLDYSSTQPCGLGSAVPTFGLKPIGGVQWRSFQDIAPTGRIGLSDLVSDRRDEAAVVAFGVTLTHPTHAALYYGASAPSALALNGHWIAADSTHHPEHFGQLRVPLDLPAGQSVIELQLCRGDRPLAASLRLADARGRTLHGAILGLPQPRKDSAAASGLKLRVPQPGGLLPGGLLFELAQRRDPEAAAVLAESLTPFDDQEHRPVRERSAACHTAPSLRCFLELARDEDLSGDKGARRAALDAAQKLAPAEGSALLELGEARYAADLGYPDRALTHAQRAVRLDPDDSRAALALGQSLESFGLTGLSGRVELAAADHFPESPEVLTAASYRLERLHRESDAVLLLRRLLALRDDLLGAHESLHRLLLRQADLDGALDQLAAMRRLAPSSPRSYLEEGQLLLANAPPGTEGDRRRDRARKAFAVALALSPADADLHGDIAAAELRDGDAEGQQRGARELRAALALAPQSPTLRALDEASSSQNEAFAQHDLVDLRTAAKDNVGLPNADAVSLADITVVKVQASGLSSRVHQTILRVQTQRGAEANRTFPIEYSPDRQELRIQIARILKPNGDLVPTYQEQSRSLSEPWYDLYYDLREDDLTFPSLAPGDVLEVVYRLDDSARENLIARDFGDFLFLRDSVDRRQLAYTVLMPPGRELFHNEPKLPGFSHQIEQHPDGSQTHRFMAKDVARLQAEPEMPGYAEVAPYLHVSTQSSWAAIGDYFWSLARGQLAATPQLREAAQQIAREAGPDPVARTAAAYDFVVSNTRYVGLEFGLHGFKPYPVGEVLARGFGDCKDKASLLVALLRELGVPADLVLLRTRHLGAISAAPASLSVFDHAIVYVPSQHRFLDGTARFYGSRELPTEDQGATALLIEPDGQSQLVVTPLVGAGTNLTDTELTFQLNGDGSATIDGSSQISGEMAPGYRRSYASDVGRQGAFEQAWSRSYPGLSVRTLSFSDLTQLERPVVLHFGLLAPRLAQQPHEFRPFGLASGYLETYAPLSRRTYDLLLSFAFTNRFHYRCLPPPHGRLRAPPDVHLTSAFGALDVSYEADPAGGVVVTGQLAISGGRITPADYPAFRNFLRHVDQTFETALNVQPGNDRAAN